MQEVTLRPTITYYFDCCKTVDCWPEVSGDVRKVYFYLHDQLEWLWSVVSFPCFVASRGPALGSPCSRHEIEGLCLSFHVEAEKNIKFLISRKVECLKSRISFRTWSSIWNRSPGWNPCLSFQETGVSWRLCTMQPLLVLRVLPTLSSSGSLC
jgi:hypothetical protein